MVTCPDCGKEFSKLFNVKRHQRTACRGRSDLTKGQWTCSKCPYETTREDNLKRHIADQHQLETPPGTLSNIIAQNYRWIRTYSARSNRHQDRYNFQLASATVKELMGFVELIFEEQRFAYKLNISLGFVLQEAFTDRLVYYYASNNNRLFAKPITVTARADLSNIETAIDKEDLLEYCRQQRPNTSYVVLTVTNAHFYVDKMSNFPIGCGDPLPDYISVKRSVIGLIKDHWGRSYNDNLCFFRCLAYHKLGAMHQLEVETRTLAKRYFECCFAQKCRASFKGVTLTQIHALEHLYSINVNIYTLEPDGTARRIRSSPLRYKDTMNLNLYNRHFSYIKDIKAYSGRWSCPKCNSLFSYVSHMQRHMPTCGKLTKLKFRGGGYGHPKDVFDKLLEFGIITPGELRFYPFRAAYDFEAFFEPLLDERVGRKEQLVSRLVPASVSVCSNVPQYTKPQCLVSKGDPREVVGKMYEYLLAISASAFELITAKFDAVLSNIDRVHSQLIDTDQHHRAAELTKLQQRLLVWMKRFPVLGFNSGKFDLNLIRQFLFPHLISKGVTLDTIIKRGNDYLCVATDSVVFLDIKNYVAAGTSYDGWLKGNNIELRKGIFPYEWFTGLEKLNETKLPGKEAFWSSLRQCGVSESEYAKAVEIWRSEGCKTMKDYLVWYNNRDVVPFLEAAEKMHMYWANLGIDPFKSTSISLPGLALCFLSKFMQPHTILPLIPKGHEDIYELLMNNIVGGLSIVMHRYHEVGKTVLPNGQKTGWIYSFDANSLYLWALGEATGTGIYSIWKTQSAGRSTPAWRRGEKHDEWDDVHDANMRQIFRRQSMYRCCKREVEWLEWYASDSKKPVDHRFNGRQLIVRIAPNERYCVDGFIPGEGTILQFHGCYWHGHMCKVGGKRDPENAQRRRSDTEMITGKLRNAGFNVIEKWECEWLEERKNPEVKAFIDKHITLGIRTACLRAGQIVDKVRSGELFGLVECDIEVPGWNSDLLDWFEEFPPICKNVNISFADIGEHMQQHASKHGLMGTPRRNLINSFWSRKALFATPLLQWFLANGLVITRIHQAIEMKPKRCFAQIRDEVIKHRRAADANPDYKTVGENWKTLGNSLYGKPLTRKERHKKCKIVPDEKVYQYVNSPRFNRMEEVGDNAYEVSLDKSTISIDLPITVAFFVYHNAKLRMLQFVYDFLKKYLEEGSYQLVCSDTDSIIAAYASRNLDVLVKPEYRTEYLATGKAEFLATDVFSSRTPGLFKVELSATWILALCSKTYLAVNSKEGSKKVTTKGLSKRTNSFDPEDFKGVLTTKRTAKGINHGFRIKRAELFQYRVEKAGLPYLYVKRRVLDDGVSTRALLL